MRISYCRSAKICFLELFKLLIELKKKKKLNVRVIDGSKKKKKDICDDDIHSRKSADINGHSKPIKSFWRWYDSSIKDTKRGLETI